MTTHIIHCNTGDCCIVETINFLECVLKMTREGWILLENLKDDEAGIIKDLLIFGKGEFLTKFKESN